MSSVNTFARYLTQRGWSHRPLRESLSLAAMDGLFSSRSRKPTGVQPADIDRSTAIEHKSSTLNGLLSLRSDPRQPFNAHKASIVERFSPIRF
jgi:hypothetical protein